MNRKPQTAHVTEPHTSMRERAKSHEMAPVPTNLHEGSLHAETGGTGGEELVAPQTGLSASLAEGFFGWTSLKLGESLSLALIEAVSLLVLSAAPAASDCARANTGSSRCRSANLRNPTMCISAVCQKLRRGNRRRQLRRFSSRRLPAFLPAEDQVDRETRSASRYGRFQRQLARD